MPPNKIIHVLWHGRTLCGDPPGIPRDWPPGHLWCVIDLREAEANCTGCRSAPDPRVQVRHAG